MKVTHIQMLKSMKQYVIFIILTIGCLNIYAQPISGREKITQRWYEKATAIARVSFKARRYRPQFPLKDLKKASGMMDELKEKGCDVIEVFAVPEGGFSYSGLDVIDPFRIDPDLGTVDDFKQFVRLAHDRNLAVITFDNMGYSSVDAPFFIKACDDVRRGIDSKEARMFLWADSIDAPLPAQSNKFYLNQPTHLPWDSKEDEFWHYSELAQKYYWTRWEGRDLNKNKVRLPQYNWADRDFQNYIEKVIRFWMETGIDGMIIDAVNWYVNCTWEMGRRFMTDVIAGYGNTFLKILRFSDC